MGVISNASCDKEFFFHIVIRLRWERYESSGSSNMRTLLRYTTCSRQTATAPAVDMTPCPKCRRCTSYRSYWTQICVISSMGVPWQRSTPGSSCISCSGASSTSTAPTCSIETSNPATSWLIWKIWCLKSVISGWQESLIPDYSHKVCWFF